MEDPDVREAVEALGGLKADFAHPPTAPHSPSATAQPEPLLNLIQSSSAVHPLLSTALSISTSTYAASKSYIPPFRYVANTAEGVAGPVVSAVGRRTGIEDYIRRGLTRNRSDDSESGNNVNKRRKSEKDVDAAKNETQLVGIEQNRERGWQRRLYYSSTGLATALSEDSRRSLKYCLRILFNANANLVKVIETLTNIVEELDEYLKQKTEANVIPDNSSSGIAGYLPESCEQRRQRLAETVDKLKDEALKTLKTVVDTISRYAGGALPEQARDVVKRHILSFPLRWQAAASSTATSGTPSQPHSPMSPRSVVNPMDVENGVMKADEGEDKGKAVRVLVMAREGLDMMRSVAEVVEGTLVSAEEWCERFGKRRGTEPAVVAATTDGSDMAREMKHEHQKTK
ncbi:transcription factor Opi1 [Geopyxis carbonaria]|nr:transcription factor Opi1 [Geopyxis carbonaria]